jgi:Chs5-Arf1p-binding protein BUD7/BCH1
VQIMANAMKQTPQSYTLLHAQCDFLRSKGKYEWALQLARQAVNCAPSEFVTWEKLTLVYIELGQYPSALLTLNSCPMFTFNGRDAHRPLTPARVHLPFQKPIGDILPERTKTEDDEADPALLRLPSPGLRGTWKRAYGLLTRLVSRVGWDDLLRIRSEVFVMEEEYRMQKAQGDIQKVVGASQDGEHVNGDNASTRGMVSGSKEDALDVIVPTIRVSSESDRDAEEVDLEAKPNGTGFHESVSGVDKPEPTQAAPEDENQDRPQTPVTEASSTAAASSFSNKRLCERWLDNLFMVLYEDLRVWTIFRAEVAHFKTQHVAYRKTSYEWEILADLGMRLHHKEEAKEAYQRCLDSARYGGFCH